MTRRTAAAGAFALLAGAAGLGLLTHRALRAVGPPPAGAVAPAGGAPATAPQPPADDANVVRQGFPARAADPGDLSKSDTGWEVEWEITQPTNKPGSTRAPSSVLKILWARFMYKDKAKKVRWITVLRNLDLGEVFVPYDTGSPRYLDVSKQAFWIVKADPKLLGPACVAPGAVLASKDLTMHNKVYKEVHDDGLRWVHDGGLHGPDRGRRGEKMLLWALLHAGNYRYVIEYGFSDDGAITCRLGATARNTKPYQADGSDVHLHVGCWMFDPDLGDPTTPNVGGPDQNVVRLVRRLPRNPGVANGLFRVDVRPFGAPLNGPAVDGPAFEGSAVWVPEEFTTLRVESKVRKKGPAGRPTAYDLVPVRSGSVRNFPSKEFEFINQDFWVTGVASGPGRFIDVPKYLAKPPRAIDGKPITVWHNAPLLHVPRAEDFGLDGTSNVKGVALTSWVGFLLKPRNLFDSTPLYGP
jgi:hypothetical protein